jgi:hypothetical protein
MADAVQGAVRNGNIVGQASLALNQLGEQFFAQGLPPYTESVRKGTAWATMSVTAVAGLVVRPTTVCAFELWNGYQSGGPSLIIDRLFYFNLVTTAANEGWSGWAQVTAAKATPSSASLAIRGASGKAYGGSAVNAIGTTVIDSGWFPWTNQQVSSGAGVTPYGCAVANVEGRIIVPPGSSLCLHVVSSLVGQTFTQGASWFEEQITIV